MDLVILFRISDFKTRFNDMTDNFTFHPTASANINFLDPFKKPILTSTKDYNCIIYEFRDRLIMSTFEVAISSLV